MSVQWITEATLVLPDEVHDQGALAFFEDKIIYAGPDKGANFKELQVPNFGRAEKLNLGGDILIPGLIDTHVHGTGGFDVMDSPAGSLPSLAKALLAEGTTAFLPTTMSSSLDELDRVLAAVEDCRRGKNVGAEILGVHLEGPFLAPAYKGAQALESIFPMEQSAIERLQELIWRYPGLIKILTLAVERPDAGALIELAANHGVIPSVGHSGAGYEEMQKVIEDGLCHVTHAFNAMPGIHHRKPGLLSAALLDNRVWLELIADGVHIHPAVLDLTLRQKPRDKVCLVSDGSRSVGMPDGNYGLGGQQTFVANGVARLSDGTIAGSAFPLLQGIRTLVQDLNYSLAEALRYAALNPARLIGATERLGSLEAGKEATFVRLSPSLQVKEVWVKGKLVVERSLLQNPIQERY